MFNSLLLILVSVVLMGAGAATSAQTYSWKDANGKVHYSDRPPTDKLGETRKLERAPVEPSDAALIRKSLTERKFDQREKDAGKQGDAGKVADATVQEREREESCKRARSILAGLDSGHIRFGLNDRGERIALDGLARDAELKRAKKAVADACKPPAAK